MREIQYFERENISMSPTHMKLSTELTEHFTISILLCKFRWSCQWQRIWSFWSTHRNIFPLKILNFSHIFKITFKIIVVLCLHFAHSVRCSLFNIIPRLDPVGAICQPSKSGFGDNGGPQFICCVDVHESKVNEVWNLGEDDVTPKVHPTARVDVDAGVN